jgi:ankyrin repeat protein
MNIFEAVENGDLRKVKNLIKELIEKGTDVNVRDIFDKTPLLSAIRYKHLEIVKYLIEEGADVNARSMSSQTALHWAIYNGHSEIVECLVENGAVK